MNNRGKRGWILAAALLAAWPAAAATGEAWETGRSRGQARQIDFLTREGTWMSVDASPDGRWLVFDLLGNLYRLPMGGGRAECLTPASGVALNTDPKFSPDGSRIAFVSDRSGQAALWVMNSDGSGATKLGDAGPLAGRVLEPEWAPDGTSILATIKDHRGSRIERFFLDRRPSDTLAEADTRSEVGWASIDAAGRTYVHRFAGPAVANIRMTRGDYRIERLSAQATEVVVSGPLAAIAPDISPDQRWLAFARRVPDRAGGSESPTGLYVRDLRTGEERLLSRIEHDLGDGVWQGQRGRILPGYAWLPDSQAIVVSRQGRFVRIGLDGSSSAIPFEARVQRTVSERVAPQRPDWPDTVRSRFLRWPATAPGQVGRLVQAFGRIWRLDPRGRPHRATPASFDATEHTPSWGPEGSILFASWHDERRGHIWRIDADGRLHRLTREAGEYLHPLWDGPSGRVIALRGDGATGRNQGWDAIRQYEVVAIDPGNEAPTVLASLEAGEREAPSLKLADDGRIWTVAQRRTSRGVASDLTTIDARTGERQLVARLPYVAAAAPSPDGRSVALEIAGDIYVSDTASLSGGRPDSLAELRRRRGMVRAAEPGIDARWRDASRIEFASGNRIVTLDTRTGRSARRTIAIDRARAIGKQSLLFTNARVLAFNGKPPAPGQDVLIRQGRIACVGRCYRAGADQIIDAAGATIMPGLIDAHGGVDAWYHGVVMPQRDRSALAQLAYGITTTFAPSSWSQYAYPLAERIAAGDVPGPRLLLASDKVRPTEPGPWQYPLATVADAQRIIARISGWGGAAVKLQSSRMSDRRANQLLAEAARQLDFPITAHEDFGALEHGLALALDGFTNAQHFPIHVPLYSDVTRFYALTGLTHHLTLGLGGSNHNMDAFLSHPSLHDGRLARLWSADRLAAFLASRSPRSADSYRYALQARAMKPILDHGGRVAIGSHGDLPGLGAHLEIWMLASGLDGERALAAATIEAARGLGIEREVGSIEVGKRADLLVLNRDPLTDIEATIDIRLVVKDGMLLDPAAIEKPLATAAHLSSPARAGREDNVVRQ